MRIALALVVLVLVSVVLHLLSPWWLTPIASNWGAIDTTINISFWITGFVFIAVNLFMAYAIYRFRHRQGSRAHYEPENKKLEAWLTGLTALGVAGLLAPGLFVWADYIDAPDDAPVFEVVGKQWHWMYRFPGADGELGRSDVKFVDARNPFGLDPADPSGRDDRLIFSNIVHLPVDQPVKVFLRSQDVLHNWAVPQFRAKMDLVPGQISEMWLEPTRTGSFEVVCMQLCGMAHHAMRGRVVVQQRDAFEQWLKEQPTFAETRSARHQGDAQAGKSLYQTCVSCHGSNGEGNKAMNAPRLAGLNKRYLRRQLNNFKAGVRGAHEKDTHGQQMAAMMSALPDQQAIRDVVAYIDTLSAPPAEPTLDKGNPARGESFYSTCKHCHGHQGQGNYATAAPRLAGQHDWYLVRQLKHFQAGIRGAHPRDSYGMQMRMMAEVVQDEQAIRDVVAYINSLEGTPDQP